MLPSQICRQTCPEPIHWPQDATGWRGVQGQRLWLGGTALELKPTVASFLWWVTRDFRWRRCKKMPPRAQHYGLWPVGPMEGREVWDPRLVGGTVSSTREGRHQKTSQGGEGIFHALPQWLWELDSREATLQAPPALPRLCRKRFMPPANSIFACRDIQEIPREKVVAYARGLQHWAEQNNPPV